MSPTTSIRWTCVKHLIDLLRDHALMAGVVVEPGWPGDQVGPETVWVADLDGQVNIPVMTGGRKQRDDLFRIPFEIRIVGNVDLDATFARLTEIVSAIEDVLADSPTLSELDGVVSAEVTEERFSIADVPATGRVGMAELVVSVHSRLA